MSSRLCPDKSRTIAFVSTLGGAPWGGSELLWSQAAEDLATRGHTVHASIKQWPTEPAAVSVLRARGVQVVKRNEGVLPLGLRLRRKVTRRLSRWLGTGEISWLDQVKPDLVCISSGDAFGAASWMRDCASRGIPYVGLAQANMDHAWPDDTYAQELRAVFTAARRCFFVSESNLRLFEMQIAHQLSNSEIARNPVAVPRDGMLDWPQQSDGIFRLACVARLHPPSKGQDLLLSVLRDAAWRSRPLRVSLYGAGPQRQTLVRLIEQWGLEEQIEVKGHVKSVHDIWRSHHALVLPSRYEGLPLSLLEAMLCARPAIATAVSGIPEILEDEVTGFLAAAPTVAHVAEALERAWQRRDDWPRMGLRAAARTREFVPDNAGRAFADRLLALEAGADSIQPRGQQS